MGNLGKTAQELFDEWKKRMKMLGQQVTVSSVHSDFTGIAEGVDADGTLRQEWLLIRQDPSRTTYSLSNAPSHTSLTTMATRKSQRYFIERSNQEAKAEFGWDEFQALKYRAWQHQLAFTIMASWFITEIRLEWLQ